MFIITSTMNTKLIYTDLRDLFLYSNIYPTRCNFTQLELYLLHDSGT